MTEAEKIKCEFNSIYNQKIFEIATPVVKDEEEVEYPVIKEEQIFTEPSYLQDPIAKEEKVDQPVAIKTVRKKKYKKKSPEERKALQKLKEEVNKNYEIKVEGDKTIFACKICVKTFKKLGNIHQHIKRHIVTEKNFICQHCGKAFRFSDELDQHIVLSEHIKKIERRIW